ncbi:hypothetical protein [Lysinibacillus capsici]|uniref:hypothetical protein n=1 Tax=Lysinibacillus capsici TaxID=2115968 RepID=UPI00209CCC5B|nr:hypothetical protein [Lysinibacillus capsici]
MTNIYVKSEFALVMAQSAFAFPAKEAPTDDELLTEVTLALYASVDTLGKNFNEVFPERQQQGELEQAILNKVLEK